MKSAYRYLVLSGLALALVMAFSTVHADSVFVVTSNSYTNDGICDADCTLPDALSVANADPDLSIINFDIPGDGVHDLLLHGASSIILHYPVVIDATTQPGYNGTPLIEIDGSNLNDYGIEISTNPTTPQFDPSGSTIRGLAIINYGWAGIILDNTSSITLEDNYIGVAPDGLTAAGNGLQESDDIMAGSAIALWENDNNNIIRGNVISASPQAGILLAHQSDNNIIENNRIGTNAAGTAALGSQKYGVYIGGANENRIGGTTPDTRNIISGNQYGIVFSQTPADPSPNLVEGNYIGTDITGMLNIGNLIDGIQVSGFWQYDHSTHPAHDDVIGGTSAGAGNIIAYNGTGVEVDDVAQQIPIERNSIYANTGLGIDLAADGITPNDTGDGDSGPNTLQNFPLLTSVEQLNSQLLIKGQLNSSPNLTYRVEFFANPACDASGNGEGESYLGFVNVTTNSSGNASFFRTVTITPGMSESITATATDPDHNTSEFSPCVEPHSSSIPTPAPNYFTTSTPTLTWTNIPGAIGYEVQVDTNLAINQPYVVDDNTISATTLSKTVTLENGTYYWRVRALLPNGKFSAWSAAQSFEVAVGS